MIITYYWPPSGGAGVQRVLKFVKYLRGFHLEPVVITVDKNAASYVVQDPTLLKDVAEGTRVYRTGSFEPLKIFSAVFGKTKVPHAGFANAGKGKPGSKLLRFIRGNFFIPDARKGWVKHAYRQAAEIIRKEKIDTVFISSPPHSSQLIGLRLKKEFKIRLIADMRDPWTDIYYYKDLMHTEGSKKKDRAYEQQVLEAADEVIVVSDDIKGILGAKLSGEKAAKIHVIPNGFDESDFQVPSTAKKDKFVITYTGTIADSYKPEVFFRALRTVKDKTPTLGFELHFVGVSSPSIRQMAEEAGLGSITRITSYVSHEEVIRYMMASTCLLLVIPDVDNSKGILTGKLFEYLAARKPIIGIGPAAGDAEAIIARCEAGRMFERNAEAEMTAYLSGLVEKWKAEGSLDLKGENYKMYSRKALTESLAKIIG